MDLVERYHGFWAECVGKWLISYFPFIWLPQQNIWGLKKDIT